MRITDKYVFFWKGWLSNFWRAPFRDLETGKWFFCTEQYFMYKKAETFSDIDIGNKILTAKTARDAKYLGRQVRGYSDEVWVPIREEIMYKANLYKYQQNQDLRNQLLAYPGKHFVEASPIDTVWAIGLGEDDDRCLNPMNWRGGNLLGKCLDRVRDHLSYIPNSY